MLASGVEETARLPGEPGRIGRHQAAIFGIFSPVGLMRARQARCRMLGEAGYSA
jgi:hypothetical protein